MSVTWADAQPMPFPSAQVRQRAKAVLRSFAKYSDVTGRSWVTMSVLLVETDLGCKRSVQRGIADLKACGYMEETGDWHLYMGKRYPVYQLPFDRGPKNTRDRLRGIVADLDDDAADLGVTPVSPQAGDLDPPGDTGVTSRDDTDDAVGVTPVSPKEKGTLTNVREDNSTGAREAAARLSEVEKVCPRSMLRFYDQPLALAAMDGLLAEGLDPAELVAALGRMGRHPEFRSRKHPPQLHQWLRQRGWIGWLTDEAQPELPLGKSGPLASAGPANVDAAAAADQVIWSKLVDRLYSALTDSEFNSYIRPAYLGGRSGQLFFVAATGFARDWVSKRCWRRIEAWWAEADVAKRPLTLVTKASFEAAVDGRAEGVGRA